MLLKTLDILNILIELVGDDFNFTRIAAYGRHFPASSKNNIINNYALMLIERSEII